MSKAPRYNRTIQPPPRRKQMVLDPKPSLKIAMTETTVTSATPVTSPLPAAEPAVIETKYLRVDGPFTRKSDGQLIMFLRTDKDATFNVDQGTIAVSGSDLCVPYTVEAYQQAENILANFGFIRHLKKVNR